MSKFFDVYNVLDHLRNDHSGSINDYSNFHHNHHHPYSIRSYSNFNSISIFLFTLIDFHIFFKLE